MVRGLWLVVLVGSFALSPAAARAQIAVMLPVGGDADLALAHGAEVVNRVQRDLEESSFTVLGGEALAAATGAARAEACREASCAGALLTALHADLGVGVALWRRAGLVQVAVVLVDAHGQQVSASADGAETVIGEATQAALSQARARWAARGGSPVRVVGTPEGASITVDQEPWGVLPHEGTLSPGMHHFAVAADGHETERRDVDIAGSTEAIEVSFRLEPVPVVPPAPVVATGPDVDLLVTGAVLGVVGAGVLIAGIVIVTGEESCVSGCTGPARDRVVAVPNGDLALGLMLGGALGFATGVVFAILGATSAPGATSPRTVTLSADGLSVRF